MAKKSNPKYDAVRQAYKVPERKCFASRQMAYVFEDRPFRWSIFTNWRGIVISVGGAASKQFTPAAFLFDFAVRPFGLIIFIRHNRILWLGDWEWKKELRNE
jgi:hypothetical protein